MHDNVVMSVLRTLARQERLGCITMFPTSDGRYQVAHKAPGQDGWTVYINDLPDEGMREMLRKLIAPATAAADDPIG